MNNVEIIKYLETYDKVNESRYQSLTREITEAHKNYRADNKEIKEYLSRQNGRVRKLEAKITRHGLFFAFAIPAVLVLIITVIVLWQSGRLDLIFKFL